MVDGSTWGRAGRRLRRITLVFFCAGSVIVSSSREVRAWVGSLEGEVEASIVDNDIGRVEVSTSAIMGRNVKGSLKVGSWVPYTQCSGLKSYEPQESHKCVICRRSKGKTRLKRGWESVGASGA